MDLARPYAAIVPTLEGDVLLVLAGTRARMTGRQVARLVRHGSPDGVRKALQRLVEQGTVEVEEAGRALLFALNREHIAAPVIEALAGLRNELFRRLADEVSGWPLSPVHASVFGSAARGEGDAQSDIDLLLVRPASVADDDAGWREQVDRLSILVSRWTGNDAGIVEVAEGELARLGADRPGIVSELERDAVTIAGPAAVDLFGAGA